MSIRPALLVLVLLAACGGGGGADAPWTVAAPVEGGLVLEGDALALRPCAAGELLARADGRWTCTPAGAHAHPELAADGTVNDPSNPLHFTRLAGVPEGWADGDDAAGVLRVEAGWGIRGGEAGPGGSVTLSVDFDAVAPAGHLHVPDCPAVAEGLQPFTRRTIGRSVLCVATLEAPAPAGVQAALAQARYAGAHLCTAAELQMACDTGFAPVVGAWLGDRIADDAALVVNGTGCANFDGEAQAGANRPAHVCLRRPIR